MKTTRVILMFYEDYSSEYMPNASDWYWNSALTSNIQSVRCLNENKNKEFVVDDKQMIEREILLEIIHSGQFSLNAEFLITMFRSFYSRDRGEWIEVAKIIEMVDT